MIIINKKRIRLILSCILMSVFAFSFQISDTENSKTTNVNDTVAITSTPVSGKTVVVDAGHGVPDEGAESSSRYNRSRN